MSRKASLQRAKNVKNDEFYTLYKDVVNELKYYWKQLKNKIIYCNCDGEDSAFIKYLRDNEKAIGYKILLNTSTDFRDVGNIELMKQADIIITNPPFSLFREFIDLLFKHNKKFLILGSINAVICKNIFPLIQQNKIRFGFNYGGLSFRTDKDEIKKIPVYWYTNLKTPSKPYLIQDDDMTANNTYFKYDNFKAKNYNRIKDIPEWETDVMGVPITYLIKHNPKKFKIIGISKSWDKGNIYLRIPNQNYGEPRINGKCLYARVFIQRLENWWLN